MGWGSIAVLYRRERFNFLSALRGKCKDLTQLEEVDQSHRYELLNFLAYIKVKIFSFYLLFEKVMNASTWEVNTKWCKMAAPQKQPLVVSWVFFYK